VRISVEILPELRWPNALIRWREAERRGFHAAYTYDHLSWRSLRDDPWLGAVPLLSAVAASTDRIRVGTLVATPNFRHPALLAKDVMTLDEISGGRFELGLGAGGTGYDADVVGMPPLSAAARQDRFEEFVEALDVMLREPASSYSGRYFTVVESRTYPGCTQEPRVPFTIAATGHRGFDLTARFAQTWVTVGPLIRAAPARDWYDAVERQLAGLGRACESAGRDPGSLHRCAVLSLDVAWAQSSVATWDDFCGRLESLGFDEVVVHWPRPHDPDLAGPAPAVFDEISARLGDGATCRAP
jgi:alkanesulfonate monooxygenase SsuD/methylene tetrahydromethanopterin reductase-like flavin-dependent oxidoreductase (luciferase family)